MASNPYRWQHDQPDHLVLRAELVTRIDAHLRGGLAVKLIGGRGMGKSVLLRQLQSCFAGEDDTRAVLIPAPPEEATVLACLRDLAQRLGVTLERFAMDALMEAAEAKGIRRVIVLLDEVDQYVLLDGTGALARAWLNKLESTRKAWMDRFAVVIAGGLGVLHVAHVLGSGLLSRAETCLSNPFDLEELRRLAEPLAGRKLDLDESGLQTLAALSGGNPALATYGLQRIWDISDSSVSALRREFGRFPEHHPDFVRAVDDAVSRHGLVQGPGRALAVIRKDAGRVTQGALRDACAGNDPPLDVAQAIQLLQAAGLVAVDGSIAADPLHVRLIPSILNLGRTPSAAADPVERLVSDVCAVLGQVHRFGRDFHGKKTLLEEQVFSSLLAVGLVVLGWRNTDREVVQAAGYPDVRVRVDQPGMGGHIVIESKIWPRNDYREIQSQIDDYRLDDTRHAIAVTLGSRSTEGWVADYERECLPPSGYTRVDTPPDLVGRWRVQTTAPDGSPRLTDHLLVQIPKRA